MMLEIAGALVLFGLGFLVGVFKVTLREMETHRKVAAELRFLSRHVQSNPERVTKGLELMASAWEGP